ncbi:hypothetical protein [Streptomyces xantholiticus]|uniref:hypothetical protein n=1 Tax=Streptomyces xantholiticus TaxID=68285 RepID=UPI0016749F0D|nr:hypothetical protein [Streptomyces xantholiticus]GGW73853.1 lipoprotein [Streptomyces xantholiticus]
MRTKQAVAAVAALLALTATSCDDDGGQSESQSGQASTGKNGGQAGSGADGNGTAGTDGVEAQLATVAGADELIRLISNVTTCEYASTEPKDTVFGDIDGSSSDSAVAEMSKTNAAWGIKERATCDGVDGSASNGHVLLVVSDMARFEAEFKARQEADLAAGEGDPRTRWFVGQNFAVRIYATDSDERDMLSLGTLGLNCAPNYAAPPNSTTQEALVDGCILTNFVDA